MNRNKFFKVLALANFVILIVVFLLYRNGTFDSKEVVQEKEQKKTDNHPVKSDRTANKEANVSATASKDLKESSAPKDAEEEKEIDQMIYSSKSVIVADPKRYEEKPTIILEEKAPNMMYSSKSGIIYSPKKKDTLKKP